MPDLDDYAAAPVETAPDAGLSEAQIAAIEGAFAEHDRMLTRLRRELEELRERPEPFASESDNAVEKRIGRLEAQVDRQDQALRHVLQRLIAYFERERPGGA